MVEQKSNRHKGVTATRQVQPAGRFDIPVSAPSSSTEVIGFTGVYRTIPSPSSVQQKYCWARGHAEPVPVWPVAAVESNVAAGCPVNEGGTINLIHDIAWLVSRSDARVFSRSGTVATSGKQGENTNFRLRPFSGPVLQHMNFRLWYLLCVPTLEEQSPWTSRLSN